MIVGMLRIKNEARWIVQVLSSMVPVCERIFVMDDHSTDGTAELAAKVPRVTVFGSPFEGLEETRDKNWLLGKVSEYIRPGDWVVAIDGDEEIAAPGCDMIRRLAQTHGSTDCYRFRVLYLWDRPDQIRVDGIYASFNRPSMFRYRQGAEFISHTPGGFHCGNVPDPEYIGYADVNLLHYGYMHREDRIRKWDWYSSIDAYNRAEGYDPVHPERKCYPHMVIGDVPEIPADAVLKHGGPLRLVPLQVFA